MVIEERPKAATTATTEPTGIPPTVTREISLPITGMTCASCVHRVERTLGKVAGVSVANVNLATEQATVTYDPAQVKLPELQAAVERAGYGVRKEEVSLPVRGMTCASCVRRVERAIAKVPGVEAVAVNLATERATIDFYPGAASVTDFRAAVERAGYTIGEEPTTDSGDSLEEERAHEITALRNKFAGSLGVGLLLMGAMFIS